MTLATTDLDELARLRADNCALKAVVADLTVELATLRKITDNYDAEADAVADLAVERWRLIKTLEARCASLQRQLLDLAVQP